MAQRFVVLLFFCFFLTITRPVLAGSFASQGGKVATPTAQEQEKTAAIGRVRGLLTPMLDRMEHVLDRLDGIHTRLASRRDKIEKTGGDITNADSLLAIVEEKLKETRTLYEGLTQDVVSLSAGSDAQTTVRNAQRNTPIITRSLREIADDLRGVVSNLKEAEQNATGSAKQ